MHRKTTRLLAAVGLALFAAGPATADVSVSLVQIGGTYSASVGAAPGDTLVLAIDYGITNTGTLTAVTLVDPSLQFDPTVATLVGGVETGSVNFSSPVSTVYASPIAFAPIAQTSDIKTVLAGDGSTVANGWEKATLIAGGVTAPCLPGVAIFCTRLGNATFTLSGTAGVIDTGGVLGPVRFGTVIGDGAFQDQAASAGVTLGTFAIVPEPTTASLLALGLVALAVARRGCS
jgi:hypothetical protein